jgi:CheY-like chemotaxis protein
MPEGGRLTIDARNAAISGADAARLDVATGNYVVVSVADTGSGMSPEVREHAFEPFFTTKDIGKGTGLGLAQIYGFAKQSGGAAVIESTLGKGTVVSLYLPKTESVAVTEVPSPASAPKRAKGGSILVVEDQPDVRDLIETLLTNLGYRVFTASDSLAARRVLAGDEPIDLLLSDMVMPHGVSGLALAEEARRLRQDMKIILMSGYARDLRDAAVPREFAFLEKPFRPAELATLIDKALDANRRSGT